MATKEEVIDWLQEGVPSDYVILKEGMQHFENPKPIGKDKLDLSLISVVKFVYPLGQKDIEGKTSIFKDMIQRLKETT